ncbi:MAG: cytochrome P450, partial [Actinomycetota bacterium]|nr:cytochrome P450 [Actinomycetota bacterium]
MTATAERRLRTVTGPVLGLPHLIQLRQHPIEHYRWLHESYGEVVRLNVFGTTMYVTHGPEMAERVLVNKERDYANGPAWSHFIGPFFRRGIMLLDFDEHLHHRRILQHAFTNEALRSYHAVMTPHIRERLSHWGDVPQPRMH